MACRLLRRSLVGSVCQKNDHQADNACAAEKITTTQMGSCARVAVRRVATAAPVRVIHAREAPGRKIAPAPEMISFGWRIPTVSVTGYALEGAGALLLAHRKDNRLGCGSLPTSDTPLTFYYV